MGSGHPQRGERGVRASKKGRKGCGDQQKWRSGKPTMYHILRVSASRYQKDKIELAGATGVWVI